MTEPNRVSLSRWGYKETVASVLGISTCFLTGETMLWANLWRGPQGRDKMSVTNSQWGPEVSLEMGPPCLPSQPSRWLQPCLPPWLQPCERPSARSTQQSQFLTHRNCEINVYCLKLLSFGVICYMAIDNTLNEETLKKIANYFWYVWIRFTSIFWLLILHILSNFPWPSGFLYSWGIFRTLYHYSIGLCYLFLLICRGSRLSLS